MTKQLAVAPFGARPFSYLIVSSVFVALGFSSFACSDDPYCGDGHRDVGEECDDGNSDETDACLMNCTARKLNTLNVGWEFNRDDELGFSGDSCLDMQASKVVVSLEPSGEGEVIELEESCSFRQVVFVDLPADQYRMTTRILNSSDSNMIEPIVEESYDFPGGDVEIDLTIPADAWRETYQGSFYFRTQWGGMDCAGAGVSQQRLTLTAGGAVVSQSTEDGTALNGSSPGPCVSNEEEFAQAALELPFGPASFRIEGLDSEGEVLFDTTHQTFIGAGVNNPEFLFDSQTVE